MLRTGKHLQVLWPAFIAAVGVSYAKTEVAAIEMPAAHGFLQTHVAARLHDTSCPQPTTECEFPMLEARAQVAVDGSLSSALSFASKLELVQDFALDETDLRARELYADYVGSDINVRAGRQVITWGVGEFLFINDTFPKDWNAFFLGQPMQYLKQGSDALYLSWYPSRFTLEVVTARFRADELPDPSRFLVPPMPDMSTLDEPNRFDDTEVSVRVLAPINGWELAGYASRTHFRAPGMVYRGSELETFYPRLNTYGMSITGAMGSGVVNAEAGYYDSVDDPDGNLAGIENNQSRLLLGYSRQLWSDANFGIQVYSEWLHQYSSYRLNAPTTAPYRDRSRQLVTLRLTQQLYYQTVTLNFFSFLGLSEKDFYVIPSIRYNASDVFWAEFGFNIFGGEETGQFGSFEKNSNAYLTLRYSY
jgi:hypothetical protein